VVIEVAFPSVPVFPEIVFDGSPVSFSKIGSGISRVVHLPLDYFAMDDIDMKEEDINGDRQASLYTPFL
jgi:hypothetical protein